MIRIIASKGRSVCLPFIVLPFTSQKMPYMLHMYCIVYTVVQPYKHKELAMFHFLDDSGSVSMPFSSSLVQMLDAEAAYSHELGWLLCMRTRIS